MIVYGVALLSFCMLFGVYAGNLLGELLGVSANVGGVGIAMLLLIVLSNLSNKKFHLSSASESGIYFWSAMYIPIVVAMAAKQNVIAAVSSGWLAVIAGVLAVAVSFAVIPLISRFSVDHHIDQDVE
ncbi:MAG: malonate transporter subunit MadL [Porticoccaceae bacterium]|jgi:malonate transporter MadL subunit|nr:malonate transporter subunit MadL [Porticoccaceae bacterium]MBT4591988.1 malonate transporter subunit MadL [Porticoccaceae bacterium]MBT5004674.1 malonate transporter subunit MadL [Porticoccaceae bacterium]MBT6421718.1 malonate transporter subunit MadL [Porticoccaceae bacterium]MBT7168900.1 malonate transporter subunit MadL [Porticoccaceae bacterium]|tara:strand:- start:2725 stop:3105 length:381 start_codon:yes stop_codon:yes gene_type:complete